MKVKMKPTKMIVKMKPKMTMVVKSKGKRTKTFKKPNYASLYSQD